MDRSTEIELMRLLNGELPPERARELERRLGSEPELAKGYRRLRERWEGLALPPPRPVPLGFTGRVMAHVEGAAREGSTLSWSLAPTWVRAAAAAALVGGVALGAGLGLLPARHNDAPPGASAIGAIGAMGERVPLADSYWSMFEDETGGEARP